MAFDLNTATPVESEGGTGFDISTATDAPQEDSFFGAGVVEPARAIIEGGARTVAGGIAGVAQSLNPFAEEGAGAEAVRNIQAGSFQPETPAGQEGLQTVSDLIQRGVDIANIPLSGLAGLAELISGQGIDQAADTIKAVQKEGISKTSGRRVFEETGSPLAATIAETAPEAIASIVGLKGASAAAPVTRNVAKNVLDTAAPAAKSVSDAGRALFKAQTPTKQRIARLISEGSTDVETARFRLAPGDPAPTNPTKLESFLNVGGPRVRADNVARESIRQGFDEGVIAAIKGSSNADKLKMQKMVDIMERGKNNARFAATNRPSDVAGDTLLDRVKSIRIANRRAGKDIDLAAKALKGKPVDTAAAVESFGSSLDDLGVTLRRDGNGAFVPEFKASQLSPGDRGPLKEVIRQMNIRGDGGVDALDAHKLKRIIDNNVTFGKVKTGISGDAERALKSFRADLDASLDNAFPEYNRANTAYAETISALNSIQDVAGRKMDLSGGQADKALGTLLRRTLSNAQSRVRLIDAIDEIESAAKKHGGSSDLKIEGSGLGKDDLLTQILFVDELDSVFGPVARTSFQGQIDQALKQGVSAASTKAGAIDLALDAAGAAAEKVRGVNEANAFKSIKTLLRGE